MSEKSENTTLETLTLSAAVSLAKTYPHSKQNVKVWTEKKVDYGVNTTASFASFDPDTVKTPNLEPLGWRVSPSIHISIISAAFPNPV